MVGTVQVAHGFPSLRAGCSSRPFIRAAFACLGSGLGGLPRLDRSSAASDHPAHMPRDRDNRHLRQGERARSGPGRSRRRACHGSASYFLRLGVGAVPGFIACAAGRPPDRPTAACRLLCRRHAREVHYARSGASASISRCDSGGAEGQKKLLLR